MWGIVRLLILITSVFTIVGSSSPQQSHHHPLDPLTEAEINQTVAIIKKFRSDKLVFNYVTLKEPKKKLLLPYFLKNEIPPVGTIPRKSFAIVYNRSNDRAYEVTVNLDRKKVGKWEDAPGGVLPCYTPDEMLDAERIAREDPEVIKRSRKLGWTNMSMVNADTWSIGTIEDRPEYQGKRLIQLYIYGKKFDEDNEYARPFDFLVVIDVNNRRVLNIEDLPTHDGFDASDKTGNSMPPEAPQFNPAARDPSSYRKDLKPLHISQPDGTSYSVQGNEVRWQKFKFHVGFNGREGLVISHVNYQDGSKVRPIFYRLALAEMFVPYGDPRSPYHRKHVFDEGQYGIGFQSYELTPQMDCLGEVHFFDAILHNEKGEAKRFPRRVCMHEEDTGILWKHTDFRSGRNTVVRSQRLALTFIVTVSNYDYIYSWNFYQDGAVEFTAKLTGMLSTHLLAVNATPGGYGSIVFPQLNAQYHQHFLALRVDPEIDGSENTVVVSDVVPLAAPTGSPKNPYGQGFTTKIQVLDTMGKSRTNISPRTSRTWHIRNSNVLNPYTKQPIAWKVVPWPSPPLMMKKDSPVRKQVGFLKYNVWVTPFKDDQIFPGGYYLNNSGLSEWVAKDENANIVNKDIVLWYTMGITHIPRTEDFPIMPMEQCGVAFKPVNFFKENPSLDVPLPPAANKGRQEL